MSIDPLEADPTKRFSKRVENYVKYRPKYPSAILELMQTEMGLTAESVIADMGAGTGFLSELFVGFGNVVWGVEPNDAMRAAAETLFAGQPRFHSITATAEATTLEAQSVDFVVAGQAFHWFDTDQARRECRRILKPGGSALFAWNWKRTESTPFARAFEAFCRQISSEYGHLKNLDAIEASLKAFFGSAGYQHCSFDNVQAFDFEGFVGRVLSSSYVPLPDHPMHETMMDALTKLFNEYQVAGRVHIEYDTLVYHGQPA